MILQPIQTTELGKLDIGRSEQLLTETLETAELQGKARLIFIVSPFVPLKMRKILVPAMLTHLEKTINIQF
jgi:hypothetical protein